MNILRFALVLGLIWTDIHSFAQTQPLDQQLVPLSVDSGSVQNRGSERSVIFEAPIHIPDSAWIRLQFQDPELGKPPAGGKPTILRITSTFDGAVQHLTADHLIQWRHTSAYFNGDSVLLEVIADPRAEPSRIAVVSAFKGPLQGDGARTICGPVDDRQLSDDPRIGRIYPVGCTAWIIGDSQHCFLTAGHCDGGAGVMEFNVPLSLPNGGFQHPGPEDQYVVDPLSLQSNGGQGTGNDWAYFGCFPNTETGMTPFEVQGMAFTLAPPPDPVAGNIRITGYGSTEAPVPNEWNQVQKTHLGPFTNVSGNSVQYATDTTGGNSGSPIEHEESGLAIGIHTHGGCSSGGGANVGTSSQHPALVAALDNPTGICKNPLQLRFDFPDGIPSQLSPEGQVIAVVVSGQNGGQPAAGTGMLHFQVEGQAPMSIPMVQGEPNVYDAVFPELNCGDVINFSFSAEAVNGDTERHPQPQTQHPLRAQVLVTPDFGFSDNFETDMGWTVENEAGLSDGAWDRGIPIGFNTRSDPAFDADGSGRCFLTNNSFGNSDVDGGATTLVSPIIDATEGDPHISYWRWFANNSDPGEDDLFVAEASSNGGSDWVTLESIGPTGPEVNAGWVLKSFRVADFTTLSDQFRIRFTVSDRNDGSVVEAAVDGVRMNRSPTGAICGCLLDTNGDLVIDESELLAAVALWSQQDSLWDLNQDGRVDAGDLVSLIDLFGPCE